MGLLATLGDIGKFVAPLAGQLVGIPAPLTTAAITAQEAARGVGRFRQPTQATQRRRLVASSQASPALLQQIQGGFLAQPTGGIPPGFGQPTGQIPNGNGTFFPDFPFIPDLGDVEQFLRGGARAALNGNGLSGTVSQLVGSNQIVMEPGRKVIADAPPGYVIVNMPDGSKKAVLKDIARKLGLWKARSKPPISASDWKKLKAADRVKKKAKKIAQTADWKCVKK